MPGTGGEFSASKWSLKGTEPSPQAVFLSSDRLQRNHKAPERANVLQMAEQPPLEGAVDTEAKKKKKIANERS